MSTKHSPCTSNVAHAFIYLAGNVGEAVTMKNPEFENYENATAFARKKAKELGRSIGVSRAGRKFRVEVEKAPRGNNQGKDGYLDWCDKQAEIQEGRRFRSYDPFPKDQLGKEGVVDCGISTKEKEEIKRKEQEDYKRRLESVQREREIERRDRELQRKRFNEMPVEKLEALWEERRESEGDSNELGILRSVLREKKGIDTPTAPASSIKVCPKCLQVAQNCVCGRGWW